MFLSDSRVILLSVNLFIVLGVSWLLSAEKGERLMIVPRSVGGFKADISLLGSLDGSKGVSFHTFRLPEDSGVRLLIKNLGRQKPEDVFRDELDALGFRV
jgi:hypothetical protein